MKVCIVSPEVMGVHRNGGVGTHVYWLARVLAKAGHAVDVVYTGYQRAPKNQKQLFDNFGVNLIFLNAALKKDKSYTEIHADFYCSIAYKVYFYTSKEDYDVIHFQDLSGNGYYACMAKKLGLAYQNTQLVSTIHSNNRWVREGTHIHRINYDGVDIQVDSFEDTQVQLSDAVVSPSHYMKDWYIKQGILSAADNCQVIPYCYMPLEEQQANAHKVDTTHLAFFSRLETRKGIDIFCEGIDLYLAQNPNHSLKQISFMGRFGRLDAHVLSESYVRKFAKKWQSNFDIKVNILTEFESLQAKNYLLQTGAVAVVPTRLDNLPFVAIEAAENKLPILAANTGGIAEVLSGNNLFEANKYAFSQKLAQVLSLPQDKAEELLLNYTPHYNSQQANQAWVDYHAVMAFNTFDIGQKPEILCVLSESIETLNNFIKQQPLPKNINVVAITLAELGLNYWRYKNFTDFENIDINAFEEYVDQKTILFVTDRVILKTEAFDICVPNNAIVSSAYIDSKNKIILPHATKELLLTKPVMGDDFAIASSAALNNICVDKIFINNKPTVWNIIFEDVINGKQALVAPNVLYHQTNIFDIKPSFNFDKYRLDILCAVSNRLVANLIQVDYYPNSMSMHNGFIKIDERLYHALSRLVFRYKKRLSAHPTLYKIAFKCYHMALECIKIISKCLK